MEWVAGLVAFLAIYAALLLNQFKYAWLDANRIYVLITPVVLIGLFGVRLDGMRGHNS